MSDFTFKSIDLISDPGFNGEYPKKQLMIEYEYDRYGEKYKKNRLNFIDGTEIKIELTINDRRI